MGASPSINKMYKVRLQIPYLRHPDLGGFLFPQIALSFSAFLQLGAFFTILSVGMWIDLLSCDVVANLDGNPRSDQAGYFVLAVVGTSVL
jgi:hypothetical protein